MSRVEDRRLVLASGNAGKLRELSALLEPLGCTVVAQSDLGVNDAEEPHVTFIENALAKARHASACTGLPALADDSGLCVAALNGAPGVRSARFASGVSGDRAIQDAANNALLLRNLTEATDRSAEFVCVIVALRSADDPQPVVVSGRLPGRIGVAERGAGGFGYDPLFQLDDGRVLAELTAGEKNRISHRGRAMRQLIPMLPAHWGWRG